MSRPINFHVLAELTPDQRAALLRRTEDDLSPYLERVDPIIARVKAEGDQALAACARAFDNSPVEPHQIAANEAEFAAAFQALDAEMLQVLEFAADNIRRFHEAQLPEPMWLKQMQPGVMAGDKLSPIDSVACYVPRGKGAFPSVVLMTSIPAVVAGVPKPVIITPPGPDGGIDAATLVAARLAGVERVYKCGGAQGVAAVAYGTETVPRCLKVVGPGSPWVVAAKQRLSHLIDPGIPAGPSESIVLADASADGRLCALDLLVEAEHGPDSSAYLVTDTRAVAEAALDAIPTFWAQMGAQRVDFSATVLGGPLGGIVLAESFDQAIDFVNDYAPEHLQIQSAEPWRYVGAIRNAGEILLGADTSFPLANYLLGPNAVLPTGGHARTRSALSVHDFMKRISIAYVTPDGYPRLAPATERYAQYEGFDAHANAVSAIRTALTKDSEQ